MTTSTICILWWIYGTLKNYGQHHPFLLEMACNQTVILKRLGAFADLPAGTEQRIIPLRTHAKQQASEKDFWSYNTRKGCNCTCQGFVWNLLKGNLQHFNVTLELTERFVLQDAETLLSSSKTPGLGKALI